MVWVHVYVYERPLTLKILDLSNGKGKWQYGNTIFVHFWLRLGAQGEAISCVRPCMWDIIQKNIENEF